MTRGVGVRVVFLVALAALCAGCQTGGGGNPGSPPMQAEYRIAPPDTLTVTVRPDPEIKRELVVRPDGRISMDLIGDVDVRGHTIPEVRTEIARRLKEFIVQPDVTVELKRSESRIFYIFGEVRRPGAYPLIGDVTAVYALGMAGGSTILASEDSSSLVRPSPEGKQTYPIYFNSITHKGEGVTNYILQPGDVVYVPPSVSGSIGYAIMNFFFPLQAILGLGGSQGITVVTGGAL
jgi:polysaccharide biosynthesis/export protein